MFEAALFDMDGVIVDNRDAHLDAFAEFAKRHNILNFDVNTLLPFFGTTNKIFMGHLFGRDDIPIDEIERLSEEKETIYRELYDPVMKPADGLVDVLQGMKDEGIRVAVGSSAPRVNVDFVLNRCNISSYFDQIASGSEITRSKPDPEVYLLAAEKLGVKAENCIVFEDAFVGMDAGRRAGMKVVAVASTFPREEIEQKGDYDLLIDGFRELTLRELQAMWR